VTEVIESNVSAKLRIPCKTCGSMGDAGIYSFAFEDEAGNPSGLERECWSCVRARRGVPWTDEGGRNRRRRGGGAVTHEERARMFLRDSTTVTAAEAQRYLAEQFREVERASRASRSLARPRCSSRCEASS
jgi:hypothetical protein